MHRRPRRTPSSDEEQDVIGALSGRLSRITLPAAGAPPRDCTPRGRCDPARAARLHLDAMKASEEDGLLLDARDYSDSELPRLLQAFFDTSAPSKVKRSDGIGWITVRSPSFEDEGLGDLDGLKTAWLKLQKSGKTIDFDAVTDLAKSHSCLGGIWLLFFDTGAPVDSAWKKIARETVENELGTHAKVTPCEDKGDGKELHGTQHAISVYTKDFTDKEEVFRLEAVLRGLGMRGRMAYKPRVYSSLGVYSQNKWRLRPGIYTSQWDDVKQAGSIRDSTKSRDTFIINYQNRK